MNWLRRNPHRKRVILICGPTASGKSALAIALAKHLETFVVCADSRQVFREMTIGTARTLRNEMQGVLHFLCGHRSIHEIYHAGIFEEEALEVCHQVFSIKDNLIMCGGTGLYIQAFTQGLDEMIESRPEIRDQLNLEYSEKGLTWLQQEVREKDPEYFCEADIQNPQRLIRALEVIRTTGKTYSSYRKGEKKSRPFEIISFGIDMDRGLLYQRIDQRVDEMVKAGWENEARTLLPFRHLNALQTVGYNEWFAHFDGILTRAETIEKIKQHTRNYAKRQLTWFKRNEDMHWIPSCDPEQQLKFILKTLG